MVSRFALAGLVASALAMPATAQEAPPPVDADTGGDRVTIAAGIATVPRFEGADDNQFIPAAAVIGTVSGISFFTRGTQLYVDLIPDPPGPGTNFELGGIAGVRLQRTSFDGIRDPQVRALGTINTAYEVGGFAGVNRTGVVTSDFDVLSARVGVVGDVGSAHRSYVITPQLTYTTPLSFSTLVSLGASLDYVGGGYARTYFGVTPAGALASGLPAYGIDDAGFKSYSLTAFGVQSLTGDLRRGLGVGAGVQYTRYLGDFRRSPVVRDAGNLAAAVGVTYTF